MLKERVERYVEHVPVERKYVAEVRPIGEVEGVCCPTKNSSAVLCMQAQGAVCSCT